MSLSARLVTGDEAATFAWTHDGGPHATLTADGATATFRASAPGSYRVKVTGTHTSTGATGARAYTINVSAPPPQNRLPVCGLTASNTTLTIGLADVVLTVTCTDADGDALRYTFDSTDGPEVTHQLVSAGNQLHFKAGSSTPPTLGAHTFRATVSDGTGTTVLTRTITVVTPPANSPPSISVTALAPTLNLHDASSLFVPITVSDPEGDATTLTFTCSSGCTLTEATGGATFTAAAEGRYTATIAASDAQASTSANVTVTVVNVGPAPADADGDNYPAGTGGLSDCDDTQASVHPGALEICGNGVDDNCDGMDPECSGGGSTSSSSGGAGSSSSSGSSGSSSSSSGGAPTNYWVCDQPVTGGFQDGFVCQAACGSDFWTGLSGCADMAPTCGGSCGCQCASAPPDVCGDTIQGPTEQCDDGNTLDDDGCSHLCQIESGGPMGQWFCDSRIGQFTPAEVCPTTCSTESLQWTGESRSSSEQCGSVGSCECIQVATECGNYILDEGEECDHGNTQDGDGCSATCQYEVSPDLFDACIPAEDEANEPVVTAACEAACPDVLVYEPTAFCYADETACPSSGTIKCGCFCDLAPHCTDGHVDPGEDCDDGDRIDDNTCSNGCTWN